MENKETNRSDVASLMERILLHNRDDLVSLARLVVLRLGDQLLTGDDLVRGAYGATGTVVV